MGLSPLPSGQTQELNESSHQCEVTVIFQTGGSSQLLGLSVTTSVFRFLSIFTTMVSPFPDSEPVDHVISPTRKHISGNLTDLVGIKTVCKHFYFMNPNSDVQRVMKKLTNDALNPYYPESF